MNNLSPLGKWIEGLQNAQPMRISDGRLAEIVGLSRQQISAIKNGRSATTTENIRQIATALNANPEEGLRLMLSLSEDEPEAEFSEAKVYLRRMPPANRKKALEILRVLAA